MRTIAVALGALALVLSPTGTRAEDTASISSVLSTLAAAPSQPDAYRASVALHVRLRVFPFIHLTLHGDSTFKRPGLYRWAFHGVPLIAKAFSDSKYDLGDPAHWTDRYAVSYAPESRPDAVVLRLVPKSAQLVRTLDVAVDPGHGRITRAVWTRTDGGTITLVQTYAAAVAAGHEVVARQDATIDLPRMKASVEAEYADFAAETGETH